MGAIGSEHELDESVVPEQNTGEHAKPGEDHPAQQRSAGSISPLGLVRPYSA